MKLLLKGLLLEQSFLGLYITFCHYLKERITCIACLTAHSLNQL